MQLLEKPTVLHTPRYAYEAFSISMFEARVAIDGDLNTTTVLRREFRASGNPIKFPLLKVDMGGMQCEVGSQPPNNPLCFRCRHKTAPITQTGLAPLPGSGEAGW